MIFCHVGYIWSDNDSASCRELGEGSSSPRLQSQSILTFVTALDTHPNRLLCSRGFLMATVFAALLSKCSNLALGTLWTRHDTRFLEHTQVKDVSPSMYCAMISISKHILWDGKCEMYLKVWDMCTFMHIAHEGKELKLILSAHLTHTLRFPPVKKKVGFEPAIALCRTPFRCSCEFAIIIGCTWLPTQNKPY